MIVFQDLNNPVDLIPIWNMPLKDDDDDDDDTDKDNDDDYEECGAVLSFN